MGFGDTLYGSFSKINGFWPPWPSKLEKYVSICLLNSNVIILLLECCVPFQHFNSMIWIISKPHINGYESNQKVITKLESCPGV